MLPGQALREVPQMPVDEEGFFGIRFESIGGLGAHLAGQILAEAGVLGMGLSGAHFSSYGSEKKGTPVKSYVRFAHPDREIRTSSPVEKPHVIAVFHEALLRVEKVASGLRRDGIFLVNTVRSPAQILEEAGLPGGAVGVVDALGIAKEEGSRINTAMLGAVTRAVPFLEPEAVKAAIVRTFEARYPQLVAANLRTFERGYRELKLELFPYREDAEGMPVVRGEPAFGYLNAPLGGLIVNPGNSILKDLTASRQGAIPKLEIERCMHCGLCDLVCPDFCLVWERGTKEDGTPFARLKGIDYRYCKGCMKCVDVCPVRALVEVREEPGLADRLSVPLYPHLVAEGPIANALAIANPSKGTGS